MLLLLLADGPNVEPSPENIVAVSGEGFNLDAVLVAARAAHLANRTLHLLVRGVGTDLVRFALSKEELEQDAHYRERKTALRRSREGRRKLAQAKRTLKHRVDSAFFTLQTWEGLEPKPVG